MKFKLRCFLILIVTGIAFSAFAAELPEIKLIQVKRDRGFDYLDIYSTGDVKAKGLLLENQLQIDFPNAKIAKDLRISKRQSKRISNITAEQVNAQLARITITLKKPIDYEVVHVFGRNKSVVEISDRIDRAEKIMAAWEKIDLSAKSQALQPYKYQPSTKGADHSLKGKVIVLDPGHGGRDPGAISASGLPEKTYTLRTARKVAALLKAAGATVYLTRNSDRRNNLREIVSFTNKIKPDIFISIHYNYSDQRSISGTETYYYNRNSRGLATILHRTLISGIKRKDRGLRRAKYYTINHIKSPAVLIEPVYISNYSEDKLAQSSGFQNELATDIVRGVKSYFRNKLR